MKKLCLVFVALLSAALFSSPSKADDIHYSLTGVFGTGTGTTPLSGANGSFSMSFTLPQMPTPNFSDAGAGDFTLLSVPIDYSFLCAGCSTPVLASGLLNDDVVFGTPSINLVVEFVTADNHDYYWQFVGTQLFSGTLDHPSLIAGGAINLVDGGVFGLDDNDFVSVVKPTLTAKGPTVSTPEPGSFTLLIAAIASLGLIVWFKAHRA